MRIFRIIICVALVSVLSGCGAGPAEENPNYLASLDEETLISELEFADYDFKRCVRDNADEQGWLYVGDVISLDCTDETEDYNFDTIEALSVFKNIQTVNLKGLGIKVDYLSVFKKLNNVTSLLIGSNYIDSLDDIKHLDLVELDISNNDKLEFIEVLKSFKNLKKLVMDNDYGVLDFSPIGSLHSLEYLSLRNCAINDLSFLNNLNSLDSLFLDQNSIAANIAYLKSFDHLGELGVKDINEISCEEYTELQEALPSTNVIITDKCSE